MISKQIILMSRCKSIKRLDKGILYSFPLRGAFKGQIIKGVNVIAESSKNIEPGKDYILGVELIEVCDANIICRLVKFKRID